MKLKFHYTEGHQYTATDVTTYSVNSSNFIHEFEYTSLKYHDGIEIVKNVSVSMHDVLYIEVQNNDGSITVLPGLVNKFTVSPSAEQLEKVQEELDKAKVAIEKYRVSKELKRKKIAARRKQKYLQGNGKV